jgi:hypothetical protein
MRKLAGIEGALRMVRIFISERSTVLVLALAVVLSSWRSAHAEDPGALEVEARRAIALALRDLAANAGRHPLGEPLADIVRAVADAGLDDVAEALDPRPELERATLRAALSYRLDARLPGVPGCEGSIRIDAIYQGLARSPALQSLRFPAAASAPTPDACLPLVKDVATRFAVTPPSELADLDLRAAVDTVVRAAGAGVLDAPLLRDAVQALRDAIVVDGNRATLDPDAVLARLEELYRPDSAGELVQRALDLPPTPWLFELNGGVPSVGWGDGKVVADLSVGYGAKQLGFVVRGAVDRYDLSSATLESDYAHYLAGLESWWRLRGPRDELRMELRLAGSFDYYDTTSFPVPVDLTRYYDFDSRIVRLSLLAGVRYGTSSSRLALEAQLGGGGQYEDPDTTTFPGTAVLFVSDASLSAQGTGRLLARWLVVPRILSLRLRGTGEYFELSRSTLTVSGGDFSLRNEEASQWQARLRLLFDIDVAAFGGFVPAVWTGVEALSQSGRGPDVSSTVAVVGVGLARREL